MRKAGWSIKESDFALLDGLDNKSEFLLNYAILAPSSHNSQPWRFGINGSSTLFYFNKSRWLRVADPDMRELYISMGCALENFLIASEHFGYGHNITYFPGDSDLVAAVELNLIGKPSQDSPLFGAILSRHTNRKPYLIGSISESSMQALQSSSSEEGIYLHLFTDPETKKKFRDLVVQADQIQYADPNYKSELGFWLGQGMMGPTGLNAKVAQLAVVFLDIGKDQTNKDSHLVNSTSVLGFISSQENDRISQIKTGQLLERVWLKAETMGIRLHPMSQVMEVPAIKSELNALLPPSQYPQQAFRLGYAEPEEEHTPRRPIQDFIVREDLPR